MNTTFPERVGMAMKYAGLTQEELASIVGVKQQSIWYAKTRATGSRYAHQIAVACGVNTDWLTTGRGQMVEPLDFDNVSPAPNTQGGNVPLISWVQAGDWVEAIDTFHPGDAETWLPCPERHGPRTYALRVHGDSMTAPHGKSYPAGCIIFVDPDQIGGVVNGSRVIAKLNGDNAVTFKQYAEDAGRRYLKALNPAYPIIAEPFRVLGLVIGKYEKE